MTNAVTIDLAGAALECRAAGTLWWPAERALAVADLHLGKSERMARRGGAMLPPYETGDTLARLAAEIAATRPDCVICVGDSFDDGAAEGALAPDLRDMLASLQVGRRWIWVAGNHDPAPARTGGVATGEARIGPLSFRHIARGGHGEVSGHYHPKARLPVRGKLVSRPCFLHDADRLILPAFGTYTGGLDWTDPVFWSLLGPGARAILTGPVPCAVPVPRSAPAG